jgi:hypothetical protein
VICYPRVRTNLLPLRLALSRRMDRSFRSDFIVKGSTASSRQKTSNGVRAARARSQRAQRSRTPSFGGRPGASRFLMGRTLPRFAAAAGFEIPARRDCAG